MIGDRSMLWIPLAILCVVGCILLINAGVRASAEGKPQETSANPEKTVLNKRLESAGWGLFLIMVGGFMFVPQNQIPQGLWSIGIGVIMLGLNAARFYYGIRMSGFTMFLGILSLLGGLLELIGVTSLQGALLLIILGASLIFKPWFDSRQLFGKAEQS
jgi:Na+/H+ antiporter NhaD/arsenite permease-like protein